MVAEADFAATRLKVNAKIMIYSLMSKTSDSLPDTQINPRKVIFYTYGCCNEFPTMFTCAMDNFQQCFRTLSLTFKLRSMAIFEKQRQ